MNLTLEIKDLRKQNDEKDKKIQALENRLADLEQYTRLNDLIITGLDVKPRTYARAVVPDVEPNEKDLESVEQQVVRFMQNKGIALDSRDIEACHLLPRKDKQLKPAIILRFTNRKQKHALLKQGRNLKGTNVYINEHLTKKNADIAKQARLLRKQNKIQATWTSNCRVFIKLNGIPELAKVLWIKDINELDT
ncbi:hypothetical protein WMY93_032761, partial [Mugilogobius chulae]